MNVQRSAFELTRLFPEPPSSTYVWGPNHQQYPYTIHPPTCEAPQQPPPRRRSVPFNNPRNDTPEPQATEATPLVPPFTSTLSKNQIGARILAGLGLFLLIGTMAGFFVSYHFFSTSARMERVNRAWRRLDEHRDAVNKELADAEEQLEQTKKRLEDVEQEERHQDEERKRSKLYWGSVEQDPHCLAYGTRDYSAQLMNLPQDDGRFDSIRACKNMSISIDGVEYATPSWCSTEEDGSTVGHWRATNVILCKPWWSRLTDKGCSEPGSGWRRWEQHMENLQDASDWARICSTMPADFNGKHFDKPHHCANWGKHGIFGIWIVEDDLCL